MTRRDTIALALLGATALALGALVLAGLLEVPARAIVGEQTTVPSCLDPNMLPAW